MVDTCATAELCELTHQQGGTTCVEASCALTDRWCGGTGGNILYQCPASLISSEATVVDTCETAGLCELTQELGGATCEEPLCDVGDTRCGGTGNTTLQMCNSDQTGFVDCDTCTTAQLCTDSLSATTCNSSACLVCSRGEAHCNASGDYETCNAARTGFDVTDCLGNGCDQTMGGCLESGAGGAEG